MASQWINRLVKAESWLWKSDEWQWITSTRIRPEFVIRAVIKWSLVIALFTVVYTIVWQRDPASANLILGASFVGLLYYFIVDEVTGAFFEDDPVLLRALDK